MQHKGNNYGECRGSLFLIVGILWYLVESLVDHPEMRCTTCLHLNNVLTTCLQLNTPSHASVRGPPCLAVQHQLLGSLGSLGTLPRLLMSTRIDTCNV